jgi:hypothetical protein
MKNEGIREMADAIRDYDAGGTKFRVLLDRLEYCVDRLDDEDVAWKESFQSAWGRMEDAYAYASFKGEKYILEQDLPAVERSLSVVRRLVAERLV